MTAPAYLQPFEYGLYGIDDAKESQVESATRILNTHLMRPEGLIWAEDANGMPAWMASKTPTRTFKLPAPVPPGSNLQITIPGAQFGPHTIGEMAVLDRENADAAEACTVIAASGNTLTLGKVQFAHEAQASMEFGLTIVEELPVPQYKPVVRLSRPPVAQLLSGVGRYAMGRRSQQIAGLGHENGLIAITAAFGGPPAWSAFPIGECDINPNTGEIWVPPGLLQGHFSDVRLHYVAGWSDAALPEPIKQAVANIVRGFIDTAMPGNIKLLKAGDSTIEKFAAGSLDDDIKLLVEPYKARVLA